ncbi:hypothetical protein HYY73_06415 [Candidatus Woesearchaeota archaeon]|nr:hypothetical protein [Candidatus Woesearchaeota archaeon]
MASPSEMLTFLLVFLVGFITGKLFAALQFARMRNIGKAEREEARVRRSVDNLVRLGRKL